MEPDKDELELTPEKLIEIFDAALSSDNPIIKKALRNLLLVTTLIDSEIPASKKIKGPLKGMMDQISALEKAVRKLEDNLYAEKREKAVDEGVRKTWYEMMQNREKAATAAKLPTAKWDDESPQAKRRRILKELRTKTFR